MGSSKIVPGDDAGEKCNDEDYNAVGTAQEGGLLGEVGSNQMVRKLRSRQVIEAIRQMEKNPVMIPNFGGFSFQPFLVPASWPMNVVFLRRVFGLLLEQSTGNKPGEEHIDTSLFCRTQVRIFKLFQKEERDAAEFIKYDKGDKGYVTWSEVCECWSQEGVSVQLTLAERIYFSFDQQGSGSSGLSSYLSSFIMILIAISSVSFVCSSSLTFKKAPDHCPECEPEPLFFFSVMEFVAGICFSVEYFARFFCCSEVRFKYLDDEVMAFTLTADIPISYMTRLQRVWYFLTQPSNVIDLFAILPFYLEPVMPVNANLMVLRLIRLTRVFRVLKMGNLSSAKEVLAECIELSKPSLGMVLFIVAMQVLISSCLVFYAEIGTWDPEEKTYMRPCSPAASTPLCSSPFTSIPATFWWTIETVTTVGYGDFAPTTGLGRLVGAITIIGGVIAFALPVGIIASNFDVAQARWDAKDEGIDEKQKADDEAVVAVLMDAFGVDGRAEVRFDIYDYDGDLQYPDFLGYCCLDVRSLGLEASKAENVIFTLPLREDRLIAARRCKGSITVKIQWIPDGFNPTETVPLRSVISKNLGGLHVADSLAPMKVQRIPPLTGQLKVTIVNAKGLLNLDSRGQSDPFVVVTLYDQHTSPPNFVRWESSVVKENCNPVFNQTTVFNLNWIPSNEPPKKDMSGSYDVTPPDDKSKRLSKESVDAILQFPAQKIMDLQDKLLSMGAKYAFNDEFNGVQF
jgi:hypothetical protein